MAIPKTQINPLRSIFSGSSKELLLEYDEELDGLSVYLHHPDQYVSPFILDDSVSLLINAENQVIGFQLTHFVSTHLNAPELQELKKTWETKNLAQKFSNYKYICSAPDEADDGDELVKALFRRSGSIPRML